MRQWAITFFIKRIHVGALGAPSTRYTDEAGPYKPFPRPAVALSAHCLSIIAVPIPSRSNSTWKWTLSAPAHGPHRVQLCMGASFADGSCLSGQANGVIRGTSTPWGSDRASRDTVDIVSNNGLLAPSRLAKGKLRI